MARIKDLLEKYPDYFERLGMAESSGGKFKESDKSSAAGIFQFIKKTWQGMIDKYDLPYTLEDRFDDEKSLIVGKLFTEDNRKYMARRLGKDINDTELYFGHVFGMGGGSRLIENIYRDPYSKVDVENLPRDVVSGNRNIFYDGDRLRTNAELYKEMAERIGSQEPVNIRGYTEPTMRGLELYGDPYAQELYGENLTSLQNTEEIPTFGDDWKRDIFSAREEREHILNMIDTVGLPGINRNA